MRVLALDTALTAASVCLFDAASETVAAQEVLHAARGHEVTLAPMIARVLKQGGARARPFDRIAVTVGPGSFTGLRIAIAAAKALGLVYDTPVVGVSTLAAFAAPALLIEPMAAAVSAIFAREGRMYVGAFVKGRSVLPMRAMTAREAVRAIGEGHLFIAGPAAAALALEAWKQGLDADVVSEAGAPGIDYVARLGAAADPATAPARPFYADADENL